MDCLPVKFCWQFDKHVVTFTIAMQNFMGKIQCFLKESVWSGISSSRFCNGFKFFMQISCIDQQKAAFPNINTTLVCFCSGGKIVPNKVKARWTNMRLQASCSSAVLFLNKVFLGVFNESVVWFNDSLIKKQSLVSIYWCNNVICRKSHFKIPTTNAQTDILSGNMQTDKHPSLSNSRVRIECCIIVMHMIIAGIVLFFLGFYCLEGTSRRPSSQFLCPQGYYCEEGTGVPHGSPCPAGTAGGQLGQTSRAACKRCAEGRFCPAG